MARTIKSKLIYGPFVSRLLGNFEEAAQDLRLACKIDFDETADEWLKEVTPNVSMYDCDRLSSDHPRSIYQKVVLTLKRLLNYGLKLTHIGIIDQYKKS